MCFLGRHDEARLLFQKNKLNSSALVITRFHLGLSYTRTSDYHKAKSIFIENFRTLRKESLDSEAQFFVFQGMAFFQFFFSKHHSSQYFSNKALQVLLKWKKGPPLLDALVKDLIAHNYYQLGRPFKGQKVQKEAIEITKKNKLNNLYNEFLASSAIYKSEFSYDVDKSINSLQKLLKSTPETNDYTSSEIVLQISKLLFLQGKYAKAHQYLLDHFNFIYKNENKRKVAKLNTLLAQILFQKKQYMEGLSLLRVAKTNLEPLIDTNLYIPVLGLEIDALKSLGQNSEAEENFLVELLAKTEKAIPHNINARKNLSLKETTPEDLLGSLFDGAYQKSMDTFEQINQKGILHLIQCYIPKYSKERASFKRKSLFIHPKNIGFYTISEESIQYNEEKLSKNQIALLIALQGRSLTKEEIVKTVWSYDYDPLRHDHLVYTTIRRLRKVLKEAGNWILSTEDSYSLDPEVEILSKTQKQIPIEVQKKDEMQEALDLNFRQFQILEGLYQDYFTTAHHAKYFEITRMTAFRDLNELVDRELITKLGKGKGTKYTLRY